MDAEAIGNNETLQNEGVADMATPEVEAVEENIVGVKAPPFCALEMDANGTLTVYNALRIYLRVLGEQDDQPLDVIATTINLMKTLKPAAVQVAQALKQQEQQ